MTKREKRKKEKKNSCKRGSDRDRKIRKEEKI